MGTKKVSFNNKGISQLPKNKPALYRIETKRGTLNYVGIAKRGRIQARLEEHLDNIPGDRVRIEQFNNIDEARKKETNVIRRKNPKYNK